MKKISLIAVFGFAIIAVLSSLRWASTPKAFFSLDYVMDTSITIQYTLDSSTVYMAPAPTAPPYATTDLTNINYPLIAEGYANNRAFAPDPTTIHPNAGGFTDAFFGGDAPTTSDAYGASSCGVFTKQNFNMSHFPITLESNFYNQSNAVVYNEFYFWIGTGTPEYYNPANAGIPNLNTQTDISLGGFPNRLLFINTASTTEPSFLIKDTIHSLANFGVWNNFKLTLDIVNNDLVARDVRLNGTQIFSYDVVLTDLASIDWENNFKLGLGVDDLASGFSITYNDTTTVHTGINNISAPQKTMMTVFPNPALHQLIVNYSAVEVQNIEQVSISDAIGKQWTPIYAQEDGRLILDVSKLPAGTYFVHLRYNGIQNQTLKFLKQ